MVVERDKTETEDRVCGHAINVNCGSLSPLTTSFQNFYFTSLHSAKTLVTTYKTAQHYNPEDHNLH